MENIKSNNAQENNEFNLAEFNKAYELAQKKKELDRQEFEDNVLKELNKPKPKKELYELGIVEIFIRTKDSIFDLLDDLLQGDLNYNTFLKDNRMFFLGLFIILLVIIVHMYNTLFLPITMINK